VCIDARRYERSVAARIDAVDPAAAPVIAGRYTLRDRVGHGASGSVYRAHDRVEDREVALKLLSPGQLAEREAEALARVDHPHVIALHHVGEADGHWFLDLELLDGVELRAWLTTDPVPTPAQRLAAFLDAGRGLAAAHDAGVVHGDFKPSNVIRTRDGRVVVIDFGLASRRELETGEHELSDYDSGATPGTLASMAPEQLAGRGVDERSDQFSFCVALWEALAGQRPFCGDPRTCYQAMQRGPEPPNLVVPPPILATLTRGLAFEPSERFTDMHALLRELESEPRAASRPGLRKLAAALRRAVVGF
jgi:eukaryotic-like serine/threonine-protein kinase